MEKEQKIYCWVEYIDDYNDKHLAPIQEKNELQYIQNNYNVINIENVGV